ESTKSLVDRATAPALGPWIGQIGECRAWPRSTAQAHPAGRECAEARHIRNVRSMPQSDGPAQAKSQARYIGQHRGHSRVADGQALAGADVEQVGYCGEVRRQQVGPCGEDAAVPA